MEDAFSLIRYVGVDRREELGALDSIHLRTARRLAWETGLKTTFVTCDTKLSKVVGQIPGFSEHLALEYRKR
jgi:hypothetical protein